MAKSAEADPASMHHRRPHIGAFVLETLTLGMYGEPRHALREYIQNSFDAIRAATRQKFLTDRGRIDVTIGPDTIRIRDNGLGVRADMAWNTLTSVGASRKDRETGCRIPWDRSLWRHGVLQSADISDDVPWGRGGYNGPLQLQIASRGDGPGSGRQRRTCEAP